jgi:transketolase
MRNTLGQKLAEIYVKTPQHHLFCGDIGFGVFDELLSMCPDQFHNFGISEQHMVAFASAYALTMRATSVVYTINPFITSRVHDQLRVDVAYAKAPLVVCSVGAGFAYDNLGFTHFGLDDLALVASLPNFRILTPSEPDDVADLIGKLFELKLLDKPVYLRLHKGGEPSLKLKYSDFEDRLGCRHWSGSDVQIITHGAITEEALKARAMLAEEISVAVTAVIDWEAFIIGRPSLAKNVLFVEEHRNAGLLAYRMVFEGLSSTNFQIACVTNSEFDSCHLRTAALRINRLDATSLVERLHELVSLS